MSDDDSIRTKMPDTGLRIIANQVRTPEELRVLASNVLDEGVEAFGKGMHFAAEMGMQTSVLSEMRRCKRIVPYHVMLKLMSDRRAAQVVIGRECELAGFPAPLITTLTLSTERAREIANIREFSGARWQYDGEIYANRYHRVSREHLDAAVDAQLAMGK